MKKKIAVCANGWNYDSLSHALKGINKYAKEYDFDTFVFMGFASYSEHVAISQGELNIYNLMIPEQYDGVIVFSTALNSTQTAKSICMRAKQKNIPVVSVGMEIEGAHSILVSNEEGMRELVTHLVEKHNVKNVVFIGGTEDHVDSIARLNATREVLKEHGLELPDDHVKYGKCSNRFTSAIIDEYVDSEEGLPDAFICANDIMAMSACTELDVRGYSAPENVIVTGFDNCAEGKIIYPALSTVEQNYEKIGEKACEYIFDSINGKSEPEKEVMPSSFVCGESCKCKGDEDYEAKRIQYCRKSFQRESDAKLLEQNERVMRQWLSEMPNYRVMKDTLQEHYYHNHQFEGEGFYIVCNSEFFKSVMMSEKELWEMGDKMKMEVVMALKNGEVVHGLQCNKEMIVPGYEKKDNEHHTYYLMPMHYFEFNYGYLVLTDEPYIMRENMLYPYMEKLMQSLKLMRMNLRLKSLYDKDQMTGLFNRFGYEDKALPLYEEGVRKKKKMMVMFVDINYMKRINDEFGHLHGDNAIRTVVAAIDEVKSEDGLGVRFGGDEFLLIEPECDEEKAAGIKKKILDYLAKENSSNAVPYQISVSIGFVVTTPETRPDASLEDYIKDADKEMYEIKKEMHKVNDRRAPRN